MSRVALPWSRSCFVCGEANERGLRARSFLVDDRVELEFRPRPEHAGWNSVTHGGLVATVLDEVMTWSAILAAAESCFAADFSVRLRHPLTTGSVCTAVAEPAVLRKRVLDTQARLVGADGTVYASATGRYMPIPPGRAGAMHEDFVEGPGCRPLRDILRASDDSTPE